jgi:hypothetical protein
MQMCPPRIALALVLGRRAGAARSKSFNQNEAAALLTQERGGDQ